MATNALAGIHFVYYSSLFRGLSALNLLKLQYVQNSLEIIVGNTTMFSHISLLEKHYIGCRSSTALSLRLPCLHISGNPKYFEPFLISRHSAYNTRRSQSDGMFLQDSHFSSVFKSHKHFGFSFVYNAPMIWNDLPDMVHLSP